MNTGLTTLGNLQKFIGGSRTVPTGCRFYVAHWQHEPAALAHDSPASISTA
jgi:hypothetical protein